MPWIQPPSPSVPGARCVVEAGPAEGDLGLVRAGGVGLVVDLPGERIENTAADQAGDRRIGRVLLRCQGGIEDQQVRVHRHRAAGQEVDREGDDLGRCRGLGRQGRQAVDGLAVALPREGGIEEVLTVVGDGRVAVEDLVADVDAVPVDAAGACRAAQAGWASKTRGNQALSMGSPGFRRHSGKSGSMTPGRTM